MHRDEQNGKERALILVKALPHVGQAHGETVCCAGLTLQGQWRRLYPIHFRKLRDNQFSRWDWVEYEWRAPKGDLRPESRRVQEETIVVSKPMPLDERASFLDRVITRSTDEAVARGSTLTLIRPVKSEFYWRKKKPEDISKEKAAYQDAARQLSFLDQELKALNPCPYAFHFLYETEDGKSHTATCDDWETAAMFYNFQRSKTAEAALKEMAEIFNEKYPARGMAFAMGTHSRRPKQWLLVGVLRVDRVSQRTLF